MEKDRTVPYEFVRIAVMLATLTSLVLICGYLVLAAFNTSYAAGIRSTAGVLFPLVIGGFIAVFNRNLFHRLVNLPVKLAFLLAVGFGLGIMLLLRHLSALEFAPLAELIVAAGLSVLLYAPGALPGLGAPAERSDRWLSYYFGIVSGMLGYVVFMGFPFQSVARLQ